MTNYWEEANDVLIDATLFLIEFVFNLYLKFARILLKVLMPLTKRLVTERMESYGLKINGDSSTDPQVSIFKLH